MKKNSLISTSDLTKIFDFLKDKYGLLETYQKTYLDGTDSQGISLKIPCDFLDDLEFSIILDSSEKYMEIRFYMMDIKDASHYAPIMRIYARRPDLEASLTIEPDEQAGYVYLTTLNLFIDAILKLNLSSI